MNKFETTLEGIKSETPKIREVAAVFLYGSFARGDFSIRHSDVDILVIVDKPAANARLIGKIDDMILPIGAKNGVKIHIEYQGLRIQEKDQGLMEKMVEEGKLVYSRAFLVFPSGTLGLKQYIIYEYFSPKASVKTRLSQLFHGKKSWYYKGEDKVVKSYKGICDDKEIFCVGRGAVIVAKKRQGEIIQTFERLGAEYKVKKIVYF